MNRFITMKKPILYGLGMIGSKIAYDSILLCERNPYIDYKLRLNGHCIDPQIRNIIEEYQITGKAHILLKVEDSEAVVKILQEYGIPLNSIYVYKQNMSSSIGNVLGIICGGGTFIILNTMGSLTHGTSTLENLFFASIGGFIVGSLAFGLGRTIDKFVDNKNEPMYNEEPLE